MDVDIEVIDDHTLLAKSVTFNIPEKYNQVDVYSKWFKLPPPFENATARIGFDRDMVSNRQVYVDHGGNFPKLTAMVLRKSGEHMEMFRNLSDKGTYYESKPKLGSVFHELEENAVDIVLCFDKSVNFMFDLTLQLNNLPTKAGECYENQIGLDLDIVVDGKEIKASKMLLACNSMVFEAMLFGQWRENVESRLEINNTVGSSLVVEFELMKMFIHVLHGVSVKVSNVITAIKLSEVCKLYEVRELAKKLENFVERRLNKDNCLELLLYSHTNGIDDFVRLAIEFATSEKYGEMEELVGFDDLPQEMVTMLLIGMRKKMVENRKKSLNVSLNSSVNLNSSVSYNSTTTYNH